MIWSFGLAAVCTCRMVDQLVTAEALAISWTLGDSGKSKPGFSKSCLCLSDTRHFRHFRRFQGSEERSPGFQWVECKVVISPFSSKRSLLAGDKNTVYQKTLFAPPRVMRPSCNTSCKKTFPVKLFRAKQWGFLGLARTSQRSQLFFGTLQHIWHCDHWEVLARPTHPQQLARKRFTGLGGDGKSRSLSTVCAHIGYKHLPCPHSQRRFRASRANGWVLALLHFL